MKTLILLVGKSGSGKNWLLENSMFKSRPVCSYTTRTIRENETEGIEHYFVSERFYNLLDKDKMLAYTFYNECHYWANENEITVKNKNVYVIDPRGILFFNKKLEELNLKEELNIVTVYINTSLFRRIKNMYDRKDKLINIFKRIIHDFFEFNIYDLNYDYIIKLKYDKGKK